MFCIRDSRLFLISVFLAIPAFAAAQNNLFTTIAPSAVASLPLAVATGDFNGDGIVDTAVTSSGTNQVSILLGTGDGNFRPAVNYPVGADPVAIVTADFNHDGHLDLAVLNSNPNKSGVGGSISILTGVGDGTFVAGATYAVGFIPTALATGDFDGDGNLDLAVVISNPNLQFGSGFVTILMGSANGTFTAQSNYAVGITPSSIAVGDFNGDGRLDLAVGSPINGVSFNPQSEISILMNTGSGNFSAGSSFAIGPLQSVPTSIAVADFNNDGSLDLAIALNGTNLSVICEGNGDGTFAIESTPVVGNNPIWLAAADFNGDGNVDLIVANNSDDTVEVLLGNGDETFRNGASYPSGLQPTNLAVTDLNGDGKSDVAIVNNADNDVQVLLGQGNGTFRAGSYSIGPNAVSIVSGDFNRDGIPDLAIERGDSPTGSILILLGDGHGGFTALPPFAACVSDGSPLGMMVSADFNEDGIPDLAITCHSAFLGDNVFALTGAGDGTFAFLDVFGFQAPISAMIVADINNDGIEELFFSVSPNFYTLPAFPDPQGAFFATYVGGSGGESGPAVGGDFNGDGKTDFTVLGNGGSTLTTMLGDGVGNFQIVNTSSSLSRPGAVPQVADFNGDGISDMGILEVDRPHVLFSNGDGTFREGFPFACCALNVLQSRDFNGDGIPDLLFLTTDAIPKVEVYLGQPDGSFVDSGTALPVSQGGGVVADFDGNGSPDVALLDSSTLHILLNKNSFQPTTTALSQSATKVVVGQSFTLSAAVNSQQGTPTGNVTFKQAGVPQTTVTLAAGSAQTPETAPSATGQFGYTALYTGDGTFGGSLSQRLLVNVSVASSTTVVSSSKKTSNLGQNVTLTASVAPQYSGVPTGNVDFFADGQPIGSGAMINGQASVSISTLTQGGHTIEADYSGDANFTASIGLFTQKVGKASSTVTLVSSLNPATYGQPVTLTATVTDSDGTAPTGTVVFSELGTIYGSVTLNAGVGQLTLPQLLVGKHSIIAQYSGDSSDNPSKATFTETILGAPSITAIASSLNPSNYGQAVIFTAIVTSSVGTPDGTVTFKNGTQALATVNLIAGQAQLSVTTLNAGARTITAIYNGGSTNAGSQNSLQQIVVAAPTTVTLSVSPNPASLGQQVTFTATVNCATAPPQGTVTFKDGKTALGTATVINGQAQFTTSALTTGTHSLSAKFTGTQDFAGSTGSTLQEVIN
jgi:hypothetical protein